MRCLPTGLQSRFLAALQPAAVDLAAEQGAAGGAEDRADGAVAAAVEFAADQRADGAADDQAGGAIVALAIIAAVVAAPDAVAAGQPLRLVIATAVVIAALVLVLVIAMGLRVARRIGQHGGGWHNQRGGGDGHKNIAHDEFPWLVAVIWGGFRDGYLNRR